VRSIVGHSINVIFEVTRCKFQLAGSQKVQIKRPLPKQIYVLFLDTVLVGIYLDIVSSSSPNSCARWPCAIQGIELGNKKLMCDLIPEALGTNEWCTFFAGWWFQIVTIWYINGTLPIKQPRGLLIQGWHYSDWLVVSNIWFIFHFIYGMSSFPLTHMFSRWLLHHHQPGWVWMSISIPLVYGYGY